MAFPDDTPILVGLLFDQAGNPLLGQKAMAGSTPVVIANDQSAIQVTVNPGAADGAVAEFVENGGSEDMVVNGSVTPVVFSFNADPTDDITLNSIRLVLSAQSIAFDGSSFGKGGGGLSTGVVVGITADNGAFVNANLLTLQINEDFFRLLDAATALNAGDAVVAATLAFSGNVRLVGGSGDKIEVTINDNLTSGVLGINYLTGTVYGAIDV
jgi:hypothetical protein